MATEIDLRKLLSSVFLSWFTPVLSTGNQKKLELSDIPLLPQQLRTNSSKKKFVERRSTEEQNGYLTDCWMRCSDSDYTKKLRKSRSTLLRRILTVQGSALFKTGVLKLLMTALSFAGPVLLGNIVSFIEQKPTINEYPEALLWISLLAISSAASAALNTNYNLRSWAIKASVQGSLTRVVFERAMRLPLIACQDLEMTDAQVNNLVQVDVEQLANCFTSIHDLWSLPLQIVVAFVLLYLQIRIAFIAGVVVIVLLIPVNTVIAKRIGSATDKLMKEKDNRLKVISEALRSICSCKMSGLEQFVLNLSKYYRDRELSHLATRKYLDALCVLLWATTPVLVPYITFTAAVLLPDQAELSSADIISAIALLNMLIFPMNAFPWVVNGIMEARVSLQRISKALCNRRGDSLVTINEELNVIGNISGSKANRSFTVKNVEFGWKNTLNEDSSQLLDGTSSPLIKDDAENFSVRIAENGLDFKSGEVMAIVGATGAGKSTLLLGLLRETRHQCHGLEQSLHMDLLEFSHFFGSFCPQIPPLLTGSIRSNVIMDRDMEVHKYADIIRGCCLVQDISEMENRSSINPLHSSFRKEQLQDWWESESDLQQHLLLTSSGDRQSIGQAGCNLSGGQRLRVGVARALYCSHQSTSIIVLDDPFSALDSHTSQNILQYLKNFARKENKTIVITTHSISLLQSEEEDPSLFMVLINDGCIVEQGSYSSLFHSSQDFRKLLSLTPPESARTIEILRNSDSINSMSQLKEADPIEDYKEGKIAEEYVSVEEVDSGDDIEDSNAGYIRSRVYKAYLRSAGIKTSIIIASFTLLMQIFSIFINLWLAYWATHQDDYSTRSFVFISSILMASMFITALVRSFMFAYGGLIAAQRLYEELSSAVFQSSISFFEKNTIGRILNRFGKDTNCIDDNLPFMINIVLAQFFQLLGASLVMAYNAPFIVPLLIVVGFVHYRLQYYYRQSSRELRRLDSVYKSPVYNLISECLHSAIVARSLSNKNNSCIEYFDLKLLEPQLDNSLRTSMSVTVAAQWFGIRLQLLGSATTTGLAVAIILNAMFSLLPVSAGLAGLSLIYSFSIVNNLNGLVSAVTETEQEMIAVERVLEYASLPSENFCEDEGNTTISKKPKIKTSSAFWCSCCGFTKHKGFTSEKEHAYKLLVGSQKEHAEDLLIMAENGDIPPVPFRIEDHSGVSIVFHDVCMKYDFNSSENTLHNINLNITSGDRVAVVGRTGSGKSSLIRVLLCLNYYYAGSIRISGHELRNVSATDLREMIGVIPQDPALFSGTVRTNLDPYEKHSTPELLHGLRLSNFANTIRVQSTVPEEATDMELERILNSEIIDGGKGLSQGQKQLICLARALVKKSPLLIFDEATASVDPHTERLIYKSLRDISYDVQNRISKPTMIMVCHKLDGVDAICNKMLTLDRGKVISFDDISKSSQ